MKKLIYLLLFIPINLYCQNDTIALTSQVLKYYNNIIDSTPSIEVTKSGIETAELLYDLKKDKVKLSYVLGTMNYIYATKYNKEDSNTTGFKFKGKISESERVYALANTKKYYNYFLDHTTTKDETYRAVQDLLFKIK